METFVSDREAFVYCWSDFGTNKLYIGVHKGTPDDGYVCSSKPMLEEYTKRPNDFSRQIIAMGVYPEMYTLETAILKAAEADKSPGFYNMTLNHGPFYCKGPHSPEHVEKRIAPLRGRKRSPEDVEKIASQLRGRKMPPGFGAKISFILKSKQRKASEETKKKQSLALIGKPLSEETKIKMGTAARKRCQKEIERQRLHDMCVTRGMLGKTHSPETKELLRQLSSRQITCLHCGKIGGISAMKRWHFDNCKTRKAGDLR